MKFLLLFVPAVLFAQPYIGGITQPSTGGGSSTLTIANAASTGTTTSTLTKLTGAPSTAVISTAGDTGGAVGICTGACGTTGNATVSLVGSQSCVFDAATTAGHYVQISTGTNGDCTDAGATYPTSGQVIGRVLSTNGGPGTYTIDLFPAEIKAASGGGAGSTLFTYVNSTGVGPNDTGTETSLIGTATTGSKTIPANTMISGELLQVAVTGQITTPAAPDNLTINMYMGATKVGTGTITGTNLDSLTTQSFTLKATFFILTGGSSCAALVEDVTVLSGALVGGDIAKFQGTGTTYDCTATQAFDVKAQWASAQVGESVFGQGVGLYIPGAPVSSVNGNTGAVTVTPFFQTLTAPVAANFTQENYNTGTNVVTTQTNATSPVTSITILQHDPSGTNNIVALDKAKIAATFTVTVGVTLGQSANNGSGGLFLSNGTALITYGFQSGEGNSSNGPFANLFTNFTTFSVPIFALGNNLPSGPMLWFRIQETASARIYSMSSNGVTFAQLTTESNTAHFTTTRYGIYVTNANASAGSPDTMITWYSFTESNP